MAAKLRMIDQGISLDRLSVVAETFALAVSSQQAPHEVRVHISTETSSTRVHTNDCIGIYDDPFRGQLHAGVWRQVPVRGLCCGDLQDQQFYRKREQSFRRPLDKGR